MEIIVSWCAGTFCAELAYVVCMVKKVLISGLIVIGMWAQAPMTTAFDSRLPVHTILREDIFAGFMAKDMTGGAWRGTSRYCWWSGPRRRRFNGMEGCSALMRAAYAKGAARSRSNSTARRWSFTRRRPGWRRRMAA